MGKWKGHLDIMVGIFAAALKPEPKLALKTDGDFKTTSAGCNLSAHWTISPSQGTVPNQTRWRGKWTTSNGTNCSAHTLWQYENRRLEIKVFSGNRVARGHSTQRRCGSITDGIVSDVGGVWGAIMWNEWSVKLYHGCDSHDEASLIIRNEPLERLVSCPHMGAVGGETG